MDGISYYPNPVKEELHLTWNLVANKLVKSIYLHDLNGRVLKTYSNLEHTSSYKISFFDYPQGTYLVVVQYNTNEQKTIKIVKK
ncbi:MAG TPA: hypothetical protein DDZ41_10790 [Flavobacterium sp.]|nr:hypothetical protein [Flavobacterium sp.]